MRRKRKRPSRRQRKRPRRQPSQRTKGRPRVTRWRNKPETTCKSEQRLWDSVYCGCMRELRQQTSADESVLLYIGILVLPLFLCYGSHIPVLPRHLSHAMMMMMMTSDILQRHPTTPSPQPTLDKQAITILHPHQKKKKKVTPTHYLPSPCCRWCWYWCC